MAVSAAVLAPSLLVYTARLQADFAAVAERSRDLCWWSRRLTASVTAHASSISGGSGEEAGLLTSVLADGVTLCADCIAKKTGVPLGQVTPLMGRICETLRVHSGVLLCDACLTKRKVYRLA